MTDPDRARHRRAEPEDESVLDREVRQAWRDFHEAVVAALQASDSAGETWFDTGWAKTGDGLTDADDRAVVLSRTPDGYCLTLPELAHLDDHPFGGLDVRARRLLRAVGLSINPENRYAPMLSVPISQPDAVAHALVVLARDVCATIHPDFFASDLTENGLGVIWPRGNVRDAPPYNRDQPAQQPLGLDEVRYLSSHEQRQEAIREAVEHSAFRFGGGPGGQGGLIRSPYGDVMVGQRGTSIVVVAQLADLLDRERAYLEIDRLHRRHVGARFWVDIDRLLVEVAVSTVPFAPDHLLLAIEQVVRILARERDVADAVRSVDRSSREFAEVPVEVLMLAHCQAAAPGDVVRHALALSGASPRIIGGWRRVARSLLDRLESWPGVGGGAQPPHHLALDGWRGLLEALVQAHLIAVQSYQSPTDW